MSLRHALLSGGVDSDTLDVLITNNLSLFPPTHYDEFTSLKETKPSDLCTWGSKNTHDHFISQIPGNDYTRHSGDSQTRATAQTQPAYPPTPQSASSPAEDVEDESLNGIQDEQQPQHYQQVDRPYRSLLLTALPPTTTLLDITKVIRGGAILQMYLREKEGYAHVSFVEPAAAEGFLLFAERNGVYIRGKKVSSMQSLEQEQWKINQVQIDVTWDQRQSFLTTSLGNRISSFGASRNLVIRYVRRYITAESIRDDLEHIHNLEVVKVQFSDGHAFISLNNIALALTARNCMLSRQKYKGMKIEFYTDECTQPLPLERSQERVPVKQTAIPLSNRFDALLVDLNE